MAELIDKGVTSKLIYNFFDSLIPSHYYKLDLVKANDCLQEEINELPAVNEAEIRAKAIKDFLDVLLEHETKNWVDHLEYGITWADLEFVAEQLKGE